MKLTSKISKLFSAIRTKISNAWLKIRLRYAVRYISRASIREKRIYYVLLDPATKYVKIVDQNEYASLKRHIKKKYREGLSAYVYARASPWGV